ncbi:SIMPL domain-containing protein [Luteimonas pelagia]
MPSLRTPRPPRTRMRSVLLAFAVALTGVAMSATAQGPAPGYAVPGDATLLSVSAQGEASAAPDVATLSAGVVTQAGDAQAASRANAQQMSRLMDAVRAAGIAERDVQTSGVSLHPQYRHDEGTAPSITGYQATNTLNVTVREIDRLGEVMDALVASGANQVHGPGFEIDEPEAVRDEARRRALATAQARAEMYAGTLGLRVRRIVSISEGGGMGPPMPMMAMARAEAADAGTPIAPGESTLGVNLDVVFELGR